MAESYERSCSDAQDVGPPKAGSTLLGDKPVLKDVSLEGPEPLANGEVFVHVEPGAPEGAVFEDKGPVNGIEKVTEPSVDSRPDGELERSVVASE